MQTDHEVFWLARYAHNTLAPLFAELKVIEPAIKFSIEMSFANPDARFAEGFITVRCHWNRYGMFLQVGHITTKQAIDALAELVRSKIEGLKADARQAGKRELYRAAYSN